MQNQHLNPKSTLLCHQNVGSKEWWQLIEETGTPLHTAIDEDNDLVCFIWRDPAGKDSDIQSVYIDLYSKTPHPTIGLTRFIHIEETDVWYWETHLPNDWLGSYFLMPVSNEPELLQDAPKQAIRQWWITLMAKYAQADPLNKLPAHNNGNGVQLSTVCLQQVQYKFDMHIANNPVRKSQWKSPILDNERTVWLYKTGRDNQQDIPIVLLFDGQHWAENLPIYAALDSLTAAGQLPEALYLLIDSIDATYRHQELACNPCFFDAIQQELLPWLSTQYSLTKHPKQTVLAGQSLGGLSALYGALLYPERFASAIAQSGSFWWPEVGNKAGEGELFKLAEQQNIPPLNIVLTAGCYEQEMLEDSKIMAKALKSNGHDIHFHEFKGGHDWLCWQQDLLNSLVLIFNSSNKK